MYAQCTHASSYRIWSARFLSMPLTLSLLSYAEVVLVQAHLTTDIALRKVKRDHLVVAAKGIVTNQPNVMRLMH